MKRRWVFKKYLVLILGFLAVSNLEIKAQVVYNNGLDIYAKEGALFYVDGTVQNENGNINVMANASLIAELVIKENFINNAIAGGNGYFRVYGNWINNYIFNSGSGTVFLQGANQLISGSTSTNFNNLTLDGSGLKTQTIDQYCSGILDLKHLELQNETFTFFVTNNSTSAIIRTTGFVSALNGGFLSRTTNTNGIYLFPVGSSLGTSRYRPVEITPTNTNSNAYKVRMANVLSTTEGYDNTAFSTDICELEPDFYHQISRSSGTSPAKLNIFYDEAADGIWEGLANWKTPASQWEIIPGSQSLSTMPLNQAFIYDWNDFSEIPYILYRAMPIVNINNPGDFCSTDPATNLLATPTGGTWSGTGITNPTTGTFDPSAANTGANTITYQVTQGGCTKTENITINVFATPDATITSSGAAMCSDDSPITLTATTPGGTWSGTGITNNTTGTFDPASANIGTNTITYTVGTGSCIDTDNITITVNQTPVINITNPGDFCSTDLATNLSATPTGGTWSGTGITNSTTGTFDPSVANTGANTITYQVTQAGCSNTENITINVFATPDATITSSGAAMCSDDSPITLTATTPGGTWSGTGITNPTTGTFDPSTANTGANIITYTVGTGSCIDTDDITITVNPTPVINITNPGDFCSTDPAENLLATPTGGTWSGTGITNSTTGTFDPSAANTGANTITYQVTQGGCTKTENITINVFATPDATITSSGAAMCSDDSPITLTATTPGGTWSGTGITNPTTGIFNPASANIGTNTITYTVGTGSCIDTDNITITVNQTPVINITNPGDFCSTDLATNLSATPTGGTWSGTGITNPTTGTFDPSAANTGANTITYQVTQGGCTKTENITINVFATPDATITSSGAAMCSDDSPITLTATTPGGTWSGTGITNPTTGTFNPASANIGTNTITYTVGTGSCIDTDNITITVNQTPVINITNPGDFCSTDPATNLLATPTGGTWSGTGITNSTTGTFDPSAANTGANIITYQVTQAGCSNSENITINVFATPDATITSSGAAMCSDDSPITLTATTPGGTWSGNGITNPTTGTFNPASANIGTNTITYTVGTGSCIDTDNITITVNQTPVINITNPGDFCSTDPATNLLATPTGGTWSGTGITNSTTGTFDPSVANTGANIITYQVTQAGCSNSENITINVFATPDATITSSGAAMCSDDSPITLTATTPGGTWSGTGITNPTTGTFNPASANIGTNTITYTVGTGSCIDTDNITITVNQTPVINITNPGDFCSTDPATNLLATPTGGTWSGTGITNSTTGTFDPSVANTGANIITYQVTQAGCSNSENITINVFATPDATITSSVTNMCSGDSPITLTATTPGGTWSGNGITNPTTGTFNPASANIGTNTITYTVGTGSCIDTDNITITVNQTPVINITNPGDFCSTDLATNLSATPTGGTWSGTGITNSTTGTFDPSVANTGANTITYQVTQAGCSNTGTVTITVNPTPIINITNPGSLCSNDAEINLSASPAGGIWSGTGITNPTNGTFNPSVANAGTHTITYTVVGAGSCTNSGTVTITVNPTPTINITHPGDFCSNDPEVNLSASPAGGIWSGNGITNQTNGTFNPSAANAGTHTITYTVSNGSCTNSSQITITVNPTPIINITNPGSLCSNDAEINLSATPTGGTWSGTGITNPTNGTFNPSVAGTGTHIITYTVGAGLCSDSDQITIIVNQTPIINITSPGDFCSNYQATYLSATPPGGIWTGAGITDATNGLFNPSVAGAGTHTITYTVVGAGNCVNSDNITITVKPTPVINITSKQDFCFTDTPVNLSATPAGGTWSGTGITNPTNGTFDPASANIGANEILYLVTQNGCSEVESFTINVFNTPNTTITSIGAICYDTTFVQLEASTPGGFWTGNGVSPSGVFDVAQAGIGMHHIVYTINDVCFSSSSIDIIVIKGVDDYSFSVTNPYCIGGDDGKITIAATGGTAPYTYIIGNDTIADIYKQALFSGLSNGIYNITITDNNGCFLITDDIFLDEGNKDCIKIPDAFTPNGDGINDEWIIENLWAFDKHVVKVFNRWGQQVYEGTHGSQPWDGTLKGKPLPTGSYMYILELNNTEIKKEFVGIVTLIR